MRRARQIVLLFTLFISSAIVSHPVQAQLPLQFESTTVTPDVAQPTDLAFLPDGRLLVAERAGRLKVLEAGTLATVKINDMTSKVCIYSERGLLGVTPDPDFASVQLEAQAQRIGINSFSPTGWSNGGAPQHTFTTPNGDRVLIANFDESFLCLLPQVQR